MDQEYIEPETNNVIGENTDVFGLQAAYLKEIVDVKNKKALIIGAGGVIGREAPVPGALIAYGLSEKKVEHEVIIKEVVKEVEIINEQETYPEREEYDSDTTEGNNSTQTFIAGIIIGSGMLFIIQRFQRNKTKTI